MATTTFCLVDKVCFLLGMLGASRLPCLPVVMVLWCYGAMVTLVSRLVSLGDGDGGVEGSAWLCNATQLPISCPPDSVVEVSATFHCQVPRLPVQQVPRQPPAGWFHVSRQAWQAEGGNFHSYAIPW